ncbi:diguanylate cyclase domain-containing protein [Devosia aquimaris]|uniref:diguanylate cyclase domain-containing protein n=1 Tax=Devosia aquimaris TaxID=2866214 RepID=UPI001CD07C12|nr:diguanylate cyclase [Devosia sp. CJK-A8-3]
METSRDREQFATRVILPIVAAFVVTMTALAGFVGLVINSVDADAIEHQRRLVARALETFIRTATHGQDDITAWDALVTASQTRDINWLSDTLLSESYDYLGQTELYVVTADGQPVFAARQGQMVEPDSFQTVQVQAAPLMAQLSSDSNRRALDAYLQGIRDGTPHAFDVAVVNGVPSILVATPIVSDTIEARVAGGPLLITATALDRNLGQSIAEQFMLRDAHFSDTPEWPFSAAVFPVENASGEVVSWFKWLPARPGRNIIDSTLPALGAAMAIVAVIIALLLRNLRRASRQLLAERADANHRALHDPLTGLGNRAMFESRLAEALAEAAPGARRLALHCLDLDRFKPVNDTLGHKAGDDLLQQVSRRIKAQLGPRDTLVRLGGDEFAIIQPGISGAEQPADLAACIIGVVGQPFVVQGKRVNIGISIGIATVPEHARTELDLLICADTALYQAKADGRNRYCFFSPAETASGSPAELGKRLATAFAKRGIA